jgi:hypothetical protein
VETLAHFRETAEWFHRRSMSKLAKDGWTGECEWASCPTCVNEP